MSWNLYALEKITPHWARRVKRHQRDLMLRLKARPKAKPSANGAAPHGAAPDPNLPQTIEDLRRSDPRVPGSRVLFTSDYKGVVKATFRPGFNAYRPQGRGHSRKRLGNFATAEEAALAVLLSLNPNANPEATRGPSQTQAVPPDQETTP